MTPQGEGESRSSQNSALAHLDWEENQRAEPTLPYTNPEGNNWPRKPSTQHNSGSSYSSGMSDESEENTPPVDATNREFVDRLQETG